MATIFSKIINKEIPAKIVYEDEFCLAFRDVHPQAPTHILVIPKEEIVSLMETDERHKMLLGHMLLTLTQIAKKEGLTKGYRTVINTGAGGGQSVFHLHMHLLGGRPMEWPPG